MAFGRLERSTGPTPMSDINMTPLIDVMLVLLVIFIITAPLLASSIRLDLPRTDAASAAETAASVMLSVDKAGQVYLDDKPLSMAELKTSLARIGSVAPDTELRLRADASVPYGRVVEIMGIAQVAGLSRIGFVAESDTSGR